MFQALHSLNTSKAISILKDATHSVNFAAEMPLLEPSPQVQT
jgi:hypothetical protein